MSLRPSERTRENNREESFQKKLKVALQFPTSGDDDAENKFENLPAMVAGVFTDNNNMQLRATTYFRKLLSIECSPPVEEVIRAGVVPRFVNFLAREDFPQLQFEAAWALANITSGTSDSTKVVIDQGAVPIFVKLLGSPTDNVREQAVLALGNIAGDSPKCRDLVLSHGALLPLLAQLDKHPKLSMLRNATWTLSNFCRVEPQPTFDQLKPALAYLERLIHLNDEKVLTDACWALFYLSDGSNDKIQAVFETRVCGRLVELLLHPSPSVLIPALRTVGNIVTGDDMQTQAVIDAGLIRPLIHLLQEADFEEFEEKEQAAWAVSNALCGGTHEQIKFLVSEGCINPLCDLLICPDSRVVAVILEGLNNILKVWEAEPYLDIYEDKKDYRAMIVDAKGLEKLEHLRYDNAEIIEKAEMIMGKYFWSGNLVSNTACHFPQTAS